VRSTTQRCWPSLLLSSTPHRAMRTLIPRQCRYRRQRGVVVALVSVQLLGPTARPAREMAAAADRRVGVEQRLEHLGVVGVGGREQHVQRQPVAIDQQVVLGAGFAPVSGPGAGQLVPFSRILTPRRCSLATSPARRRRRARRPPVGAAGPTPGRACQARSRRQTVCPEPAPSCGGRPRQRQPVLSTIKMPSSAARSSMQGQPPAPRAGGWGGISGSSKSHNRSSTNRYCLDLATSSD